MVFCCSANVVLSSKPERSISHPSMRILTTMKAAKYRNHNSQKYEGLCCFHIGSRMILNKHQLITMAPPVFWTYAMTLEGAIHQALKTIYSQVFICIKDLTEEVIRACLGAWIHVYRFAVCDCEHSWIVSRHSTPHLGWNTYASETGPRKRICAWICPLPAFCAIGHQV